MVEARCHAVSVGGTLRQIRASRLSAEGQFLVFEPHRMHRNAQFRRPRRHVTRLVLGADRIGAVAKDNHAWYQSRIRFKRTHVVQQADHTIIKGRRTLLRRQRRGEEITHAIVKCGGRQQ